MCPLKSRMQIALLKGMLQGTFEQGNLNLVRYMAVFHAQPRAYAMTYRVHDTLL